MGEGSLFDDIHKPASKDEEVVEEKQYENFE